MNLYSMEIFWSEEDSEYVAICPEFPGLSALAPTREAAARELEAVIADAIDVLREHGDPVPQPRVKKAS